MKPKKGLEDVTAVIVFCRTKDLIEVSLGSFRKFYPDMKLLIIDNSSDAEPFKQEDPNAIHLYGKYGNGECTEALKEYCKKDKNAELFIMHYNVGHGLGLDFGMRQVKTTYAYTFESDTLMNRGGLIETLLDLGNPDMYCIGRTEEKYYKDGRPITNVVRRTMRMVWPYALLVSVKTYVKYPCWNSNSGTNTIPLLRAMKKVADSGKEEELMIEFDVDQYVDHLFGRTRQQIGNPKVREWATYEVNPERGSERLLRMSTHDTTL